MDYIYVGSYEIRKKKFNWAYQIKTESSLVMVSYNVEYDSILEEHMMFDDEGNESLVINRHLTITDFEQQVERVYSDFIVNNIKLLRG